LYGLIAGEYDNPSTYFEVVIYVCNVRCAHNSTNCADCAMHAIPLSPWRIIIIILSSISAMGVYAETMLVPAILDIMPQILRIYLFSPSNIPEVAQNKQKNILR
jgi:hypothetical protein